MSNHIGPINRLLSYLFGIVNSVESDCGKCGEPIADCHCYDNHPYFYADGSKKLDKYGVPYIDTPWA